MGSEVYDQEDVIAFVDQETVMLKAVTDDGDPVEVTERAAGELVNWILARVDRIEDCANWSIQAPREQIDLYRELVEQPRVLTAPESAALVELIDSWRAHEHRKHVALKQALQQRGTQSTERTEPIDLGFSVAGASSPELNLSGQKLAVTFTDWTARRITLVCRDVVAVRWQEAEQYIDDDDRYDASRIVVDSEWLAEHDRLGALFGDVPFLHLKLNFNAAGILEVLCTTISSERE